MIGESQLDFETQYLQGESIQVSTDKTITQIASDAYVRGFIAGRLKPPTEIEIDAALRYLNNNALIRQGITHITVKNAHTMATIQASKALKQAHLMQDSADMLDQADQRDEENNISRMLISKIAQQGE